MQIIIFLFGKKIFCDRIDILGSVVSNGYSSSIGELLSQMTNGTNGSFIRSSSIWCIVKKKDCGIITTLRKINCD